jgi:urease
LLQADIGIKHGVIVGIGKAGNPDVMDGVSDGMVVGVNTEVIAGEKHIVTAGAIDAHVHCTIISHNVPYPLIRLIVLNRYLSSAVGGGARFWDHYIDRWRVRTSHTVHVALIDPTSFFSRTGPTAGTNATTCTPSKTYMQMMLAATDSIPLNFAFTGKGNDSSTEGLKDIVQAGAAGLKIHEVGVKKHSILIISSDYPKMPSRTGERHLQSLMVV